MINVAGDVKCELQITWKDMGELVTPEFTIHVYETMQTGIESLNEYNGIIQALAETINNREEAQEANRLAQEAQEAAEEAAESSEISAVNSASHESICKEYRDYTKKYIDNFLKTQEEDNRTLALANAYTNLQISSVRGETGAIEELTTAVATNIVAAINSVNSVALGRNIAIAFETYEALVEHLNSLPRGEFRTGQNLYVASIGVPDLWIYGEKEIPEEEEPDVPIPYDYEDDDTMVDDIYESGKLLIGYYYVSFLETQKVDLSPIEEALSDIRDRMMYPVGTGSEEE